MTTLLISGSREASDAMLKYAMRCVKRAAELGWLVSFGDAPGVDQAAIVAANHFMLSYRCYGINAYPRAFDVRPACYVRIYTNSFLIRDQAMVADLAPGDQVIGIWNGRSRGTKYTVDYARACGWLTAHLKVF